MSDSKEPTTFRRFIGKVFIFEVSVAGRAAKVGVPFNSRRVLGTYKTELLPLRRPPELLDSKKNILRKLHL